MKTKEQREWELKKLMNAYIKRGGVVQKVKTRVAWNWHPYDFQPLQSSGFIDGHYQIKSKVSEE